MEGWRAKKERGWTLAQ